METNLDQLISLPEFEAELGRLQADSRGTPVSLGSFDLAPDDTGSATALRILRQAAREALPEDASGAQVDELERGLEAALTPLAAAGHRGAFVAGTIAEPGRLRAAVRVSPRNRLQVTALPSRFELARVGALVRLPVGAVWAERSGMRWALTRGHERPDTGALEADDHHMRGAVGRTAQQGRGGAADQPAGGHGKTRIEQISEEQRERYARTLAETIERQLGGAECIVVQGPPEFTARWTAQLGEPLRERLEQSLISETPPDPEVLAAAAIERGRRLQYERAATLTTEALGGAYGQHVAVGLADSEAAVKEGRVEQLVVHEDAVGHLGDAVDARRHESRADAERVERLVRGTLEQGGSVWFRRDEELDEHEQPLDPVAVLRW